MPDIENYTENQQLPPIVKQEESIKLTKNAKGQFQWEVRILSLDVNRLEEINKQLEEKFGEKK
jgi:hypothetical protein